MMDQFLEYQNRSSASYIRWEQERYRQEQLAVEQWRQEAREQEKQMFGIFCSAISHCNAALNILLKAKQDAQQEASRAKAESTATGAGSSFSEAKSSKDSSDDTEWTNTCSWMTMMMIIIAQFSRAITEKSLIQIIYQPRMVCEDLLEHFPVHLLLLLCIDQLGLFDPSNFIKDTLVFWDEFVGSDQVLQGQVEVAFA